MRSIAGTTSLGTDMDLAGAINIENSPPLAVGKPATRAHKKPHQHYEDCQNCGAKLISEYCHECGQHGHVHRSVLHVIEEVFHGITHFDSRTWRSLPMLVFRPGTLTRNYVMGQRVRYVPPFAMFLFSIFAMFLVFAFSGGPNLVKSSGMTKATAVQTARENVADAEGELATARDDARNAQRDLDALKADSKSAPGDIGSATGELASAQAELANSQRQLTRTQAELAAANAMPDAPIQPTILPKTAAIDITFDSPAEKEEALAKLNAARDKAKAEGATATVGILNATERALNTGEVKGAPKTEKNSTTPKTGTQINPRSGSNDIMTMLKESMRRGDFIVTPWPDFNEKIKHKTENPDLFLYKLQNTAYKFSFLLVPLSLPFIWLMLFWKKNVTLYDHAVFSLYSLSFVSFLFMGISLAAHWNMPRQAFGLAALILPVHIFFQFKGAYQLKWFSAFWRTSLFCSVFSWVVMTAFLLSIIALGVTG